MNPPVFVVYKNVRQQNQSWCWAAVASNVFNALLPKAPAKSQCDAAQAAGQSCALPNAFSLVIALNGLNIFDDKSTNAAEFFALILNELEAKRPVSAEVDFPSLVHFVAITGVDPAAKNVWVADPFHGGDSVEFAFDDFLKHYYFVDNSSQGKQSNGIVEALIAVAAGSS